ncbi:MAG: MATE family efflux transporter [Bacillota bacterium]
MSKSYGEDSKSYREDSKPYGQDYEAGDTAPDDADGEVAASISVPSSEDEAEVRSSPTAEIPEDRTEIRKRIVNLALPALAEMTLMTLVSMADMIMVGRLGPWAITAVGLSNQPMFVAMSVFMSLNVGATALVARAIGARKPEEAFKVARQALVIATVMGAVLAVLGMLFAEQILSLMGAEPDALVPGTAYLRIVSAGLMFQGATFSLGASLRGAGDTKTPMSVNTVANLVNLVGNYLLIFGHFGFPRLEVVGAAIPTLLSRFVGFALIMRKVFSHRGAIKMSVTDSFGYDRETVSRIFKIGLPAALEQLVMRSGQMIFARIVSSFGTVTYAAHQVALNVEGLSFSPPQAFQTAATALTGQSLGAKKPDAAMRVGKEARFIGVCMAVLTGSILFFLGRYVVQMYTDDPTVIDLSSSMLKIIAFAQPFMAINFVLAGALRGAGDTKWTLYITMAGIWGVRVVAAYLLALNLGMGLTGAWIAMALDMTTRAVLVNLRFSAGHWTKINV